ncbi:MAG: histidine kinase [Aestuariivirga sp.]
MLSRDESNKMLARLINSINPRQSLTARIAWIFGTLSVVLSLLAGLLFGNLSQIAIEQQIGELYANRAAHIADAVDLKIQSGTSAMHLAVSLLGSIEQIDDPDANRKLIGTIKQNIDGTVWVGITDLSGRVLAGDGQRLEGVNLAGRGWFNAAINGRYVAGPEQFHELENGVGSRADGRFRDFLIITTPMVKGGGTVIGFAVACFDMNWIKEAQQRAGESLVGVRPVDIFLLGGDGKLLNQMLEGDQPPEIDISDRINVTLNSVPSGIALGSFATDNYLVGFAKSKGYGDFKGTDWTVVVREAQQSAYVPAYRVGAAIALSCLVLSLGLSFSAAFGTRYILRGLTKIAASADSLKTGHAAEFAAIEGEDEVARISQSLATLFNNQKLANQQLADLNRNLDRKVVERTREVQRLSEETRNTAITRERLHMSRDLHDTLAHSMLAMLTQIRLMQKLLKSKPELIE